MKSLIGKHKKRIIFLLLTVIVIAAVVIVLGQTTARSKAAEAVTSQKTAKIEKRTLTESISATGKIVSLTQKNVVADVTGVKVQSVSIKVGDTVAQGDILCVLDSSDIEKNLADARASYNVTKQKAQMEIDSAQRSLSEAQTSGLTSLDRANIDYVDAWNENQEAITEYKDAEAAWEAAKSDAAGKNTNYENAKTRTKEAQATLSSFPSASQNDPEYKAAQAAYDKLKVEEAEWQEKYNKAAQNETSCESTYKQALSTMESKQSAFDQQVRSREDTIKNNETTAQNKEDSVKTANLNASISGLSDQEKIRQYEKQIAACTVKAPIGGIVTAVSVEEGNTYSGGTIITIEDISAYEITAEIEEYDISVIQVGQKAVIKTNGTGDQEFSGVVTEIAPRATQGSANVTYTVTLSPDTYCDAMKMDMTAKLSIILESKENVLTVPYDYVQEDENGNCYIEVLDVQQKAADASGNRPTDASAPSDKMPGSTKKIFVTKGIESDYYVEITGKDIREGMSVIAAATQTKDANTGNTGNMKIGRGPMGGF